MVTDNVYRKARELTRRAFVEQYRDCYVVYGVGGTQGRSLDFKTGQFPSVAQRRQAAVTMRVGTMEATASLPPLMKGVEGASPEQAGVLVVAKSDRNPYSDRISVGRAASCDLVLPVLSVSKLHAHFLRAVTGGWELRDAESTNGTWVNGVRAVPGVRVAVTPGDHLRLAFCEARFVDAAGLFDLLHER